ncbi:cobalamin biosynthesis protein CobW [Azospirillum sp. B4]|uniref:cobalamin biosynthesis protein CobW n=1 Tax=Azospirillum sp. B4 TaxID=95605 RepID=UPI000345D64F|nr:cobalamin biosynthesis protein CobW [Azospirillum sp. B4]
MPTPIAKIPATVITGFLGAGKTTLIRGLLRNPGGRKLALIINEFGDVGVDGAVLKGCGDETCPEDRVIELANGCLCCTVADDFVPALESLLNRNDPPDHIIIETSGLALPKPLVRAFTWPAVRSRVTVDGVVAVVAADAVAEGRFAPDAEALARQKAAMEAGDGTVEHETPVQEVFEDQVLCADLILVSKTDLVDEAGLAAVAATVQALRPTAPPLVRVAHGDVDPDVLLGLSAAAEADLDARVSHHDGEEDHDHDDFTSFVADVAPHADPEALARRLGEVAQRFGILRLKGFIDVPGKPMRLLVQGVGGRIQTSYDRLWAPGETRRGRLVVIGETGLDRAAIEAALAAA